MGIELDSSSNISIDGVSYNKGNGTGVYLNGSSNVSINNSKFKATCDVCTPHTGDGIYATGSDHLQIGTGADCPANGPCNDVTYDDGFGIWLVNTHDVVIDHATAGANDTGGYVLDGAGTYGVTLENSSAHNNTIADDTFTGGTALDVASGGNGFYYNACAGGVDQPFSPVEPAMGPANSFSDLCYSTTNIAGLPPSTCKS